MIRSPIRPEIWARERAGLDARALADRHVVLTHVVHANSVKRIKIPIGCIGLNLHVMSPSEMLGRERAQIVLGGAKT
ncbi:MAG: DUF4411 family protein [Halopseudomonas sabulinigri]